MVWNCVIIVSGSLCSTYNIGSTLVLIRCLFSVLLLLGTKWYLQILFVNSLIWSVLVLRKWWEWRIIRPEFHFALLRVSILNDLQMWSDLRKPTIGHLCHRSSSLDWNRNVTEILNALGAFAKVSNGGFCQIRSHIFIYHVTFSTVFKDLVFLRQTSCALKEIMYRKGISFPLQHRENVFIVNI